MAARAAPTTCAANQTVPWIAENQYTEPNAKRAASAAFSKRVRRLRRRSVSFSSARNRKAGAMPASHRNTWPSLSLSAPPASFTNGTRSSAGNGGKLTKCLPSKTAKSLLPVYAGGGPPRSSRPWSHASARSAKWLAGVCACSLSGATVRKQTSVTRT